MLNNTLFNHYLTCFCHLYGYMGPISLETKLNIDRYCPHSLFFELMTSSMGWELEGCPLPRRSDFFKFYVLNGVILALFFHDFTFSTEKVGIVGALLKK